MSKGWFFESWRHSLAAKGILTKYNYDAIDLPGIFKEEKEEEVVFPRKRRYVEEKVDKKEKRVVNIPNEDFDKVMGDVAGLVVLASQNNPEFEKRFLEVQDELNRKRRGFNEFEQRKLLNFMKRAKDMRSKFYGSLSDEDVRRLYSRTTGIQDEDVSVQDLAALMGGSAEGLRFREHETSLPSLRDIAKGKIEEFEVELKKKQVEKEELKAIEKEKKAEEKELVKIEKEVAEEKRERAIEELKKNIPGFGEE